MTNLRFVSAATIVAAVSACGPAAPSADPSPVATPATSTPVVTVAPDNPERGLPRIHGTYLLFARDTLVLRAVLDGTALTTLRTPAVSVAAVLGRLPDRALRVAVIGAGPQASGHVATLAAVRPLVEATHLVRLQLLLEDGTALLVARDEHRWAVEAVYD